LETSRARLDVGASSVSTSGNEMTVTWSIQFKSPMVGAKHLYLRATDKSNNRTGWEAVGSWGVGTNGSPPCVGAITPANGSSNAGAQVILQSDFSDLDGWQDLKMAYILIGPLPSSNSDSVYVAYNQDVNKISLRNDTNTGWLGGYPPGTNATIENGNVFVDVQDCSVTHTAQGLTVRWALRFKSGFAGTHNSYGGASDDKGYVATWQRKGYWIVQ
jgi:hypothetical protein